MSPSSTAAYGDLLKRIDAADGRDADLDRMIAHALEGLSEGTGAPDYTASVDRCLDLLQRLLPGWHWHVGFDATGVVPYAAIRQGGRRFEATAPTVPLALLRIIVEAKSSIARDEP